MLVAGADIVVGYLRAAPHTAPGNSAEMKCAYIPKSGTYAVPGCIMRSSGSYALQTGRPAQEYFG